MDIEASAKAYLGDRKPAAPYASFDYCFNHFQAHREEGRLAELAEGSSMQLSCLHLAFYLASWGMLRGSAPLHRKSLKHYAPIVKVIADAPTQAWEIDANRYSDDAWQVLRDLGRRIRAAFPEGASDILVTKIMLGAFGCIPAFDRYFKKGFRVSSFGPSALERIARFYQDNAELIERYRVPTLDFDTGASTHRVYSRAKVIDMIFSRRWPPGTMHE